MTVFEILVDIADRLESMGLQYAVGGSLASGAWGQMRQTRDADIVVLLDAAELDRLVRAFSQPYLLERSTLTETLASSIVTIAYGRILAITVPPRPVAVA